MARSGRLTRFDAFTKTVEDVRIRTTSGGIITIVSFIIMIYLIFCEWQDHRTVTLKAELVVDKSRDQKMEISMNISFPRIPCEMLTLDVMDSLGEQQIGVLHGIEKVRLQPEAEGGEAIETVSFELHKDNATHLAPDYCGPCYGVPAPITARKHGCCNTCAEVREAYSAAQWAFGDGSTVEQCKREHYAEKLVKQMREGCRIQGSIRVNKVAGNFHIVPGVSFTSGNIHVHDLETYFSDSYMHTPSHHIHSLRFGPALPKADSFVKKRQSNSLRHIDHVWLDSHINPLDNHREFTDESGYTYMYFVKVVSTLHLTLDWQNYAKKYNSDEKRVFKKLNGDLHEIIPIGEYGLGEFGALETHQYAVTSHQRPISGGLDDKDAEIGRIHASGGIPGVFFSFDISPMKVINREVRGKTFSGFLVSACAVIGGTLTVATALDRMLYEGSQRVKKFHQR